MAKLQKIIDPTAMTLSSASDLEVLNTDTLALKPRDADGNHIVALTHFDNDPVNAINTMLRSTEAAYSNHLLGRNYIRWSSATKKFGDAAMFLFHRSSCIELPYDTKYNNLDEFTVDIFANFNTVAGGAYIINEFDTAGIDGRWYLVRQGSELRFMTYDSAGNQNLLSTSGLGLLANTWYHIRISYKESTSSAKISVDGVEQAVTSSAKTMSDRTFDSNPGLAVGGYKASDTSGLAYTGATGYYDEFIVYPEQLTSTFTPITAAIAPFKTTGAYGRITLDSGTAGTTWDFSSLSFIDETWFDSEHIKIKYEASDSAVSGYSAIKTLTEFRALADESGRYLYLEFDFTSDGDEKPVLYSGSIEATIPTPTVNQPSLDSLENDDTGTSVTLTITPPAAGDYTACQIYYREVNTSAWTTGLTYTGTQGIAGTKIQTGLSKNTLYEFCVEAYDASTYSRPSGIKRIWCHDGSQPINERILDEIKITLEGITIANGYHQDIHQVVCSSEPFITKFTNWPSIEIWIPSERKDENELVNYSECDLYVNLNAFSNSKTDPRQAISIMAADIQKALMVDYTRGGLADDTEVLALKWFYYKATETPSGEIQAEIGIKYRHLRSDPFSS